MNPTAPSSPSSPLALKARLPARAWLGYVNLCCMLWFLTGWAVNVPVGAAWLLWPGSRWLDLLFRMTVGITLVGGLATFLGLFVLQRWLTPARDYLYAPVDAACVHVALTAYNDEACIADAVRELVDEGIVDLKGEEKVRKGYSWDLINDPGAQTSRKS